MAVLLTACGGDDGNGSNPEAQPAPDVSTFTEGGFDDIPRHPRSEELSPRNEQRGVVSQSFVVDNTTSEGVLDFYVDVLDLDVVRDVELIGNDTYRGIWAMDDGQLLVVSATPEQGAETEPPGAVTDYAVQYSLSVGPRDVQLEGID